jgi:hypothetical protein
MRFQIKDSKMPLKVSDGIAAYIDDFKKSDAPQFKGKSDKERRDQAIAAYLSAKKGDEQKENVKTADRKPEVYTKPDGKRGVRMVPVDREVIKKESVDELSMYTSKKTPNLSYPKKKTKYEKEKARLNMMRKNKQKDESVEEKYTDKQRVMRDMGRNQEPDRSGAMKRNIPGTAKNIVKHVGGAAVMPKDLARRKHGGAGMETDGPAPGHAAQRGVKKIRGDKKRNESVKEEMNFAVSIEGLPQMFISADSPGMLKQTLRKIVKQPSMIQNVKRVTDAQVKKTFRLKAQGRDEEGEE